jgi:hypothetical protein
MDLKRLSDFGGKGDILLFSFPLYTRIKIDTTVETKGDTETLGYDEDDVPDILHHLQFLENRDFRFLKKLVTGEHNFFYFCPACDKELPILYKGPTLNEQHKNPTLITYSYMHMTDEYENYEESANTDFTKRYEEFTKQLFGENRVFQMNLECASKHKHKMYVLFHLTDDNYLVKTGQFPSIIDFDNSLKQYKKILKDKELTSELTKATILITHNMGVGAFLYLRRIFEKLIFEKFDQAKSDDKIDDQEFRKAKTKERVAMLHKHGYVPTFLAELNAFLYDILSKGVHELGEQECLTYYDTLRDAIVLILEEKIEMERKEKLKTITKSELNKIHTNLPK